MDKKIFILLLLVFANFIVESLVNNKRYEKLNKRIDTLGLECSKRGE